MAIVTLHYNVENVITGTVDQIAFLVRYFIYNPGFTSTMFADKELSFRGIVTKYPGSPSMVANEVASRLRAAIERVMPTKTVVVDAAFTFVDLTNYTLKLSITDSLGKLLIPINMITIKDNQLSVEYRSL